MRGRVMALYAMAFLGTTPIGAPLVGAIAQWTNPRIALLERRGGDRVRRGAAHVETPGRQIEPSGRSDLSEPSVAPQVDDLESSAA